MTLDLSAQLGTIRKAGQAGNWEAAARDLRRLLNLQLTYSQLARCARTVSLVAEHAPSQQRQSRIAVLASSTTALLIPVLQALAFRDGIQCEFYEGLYGAYQQEVLDPASGLYAFQPDIVIIGLHWRDLHLPPVTEEPESAVRSRVAEVTGLWEALNATARVHIIQYGFDLPAEEPWGYLAAALPGGRERVIHAVNQSLRQQAEAKNVSIIDTQRIAMEVGLARWSDPLMWSKARQHPGPEALPALAEALIAQVRAVCGLSRKVLACDLDNTLWGGVIGEDGLAGIRIGPGTPEGEAHAALQMYLKELAARGILLAVCSKNNPADAELPFREHSGMVLRLDDFAVFIANWSDKATNLRSLSSELSLGIDSFVFLDDNPIERDWIRAQLPQVAVPEPGPSIYGFLAALDRGRYFETLVLSKEDRTRSMQYRGEAQRRQLQSEAQSLDDFLAGLEMQAACQPVSSKNLERVTQLTNKTNQFNLTTRRYTQAQVEELAARTDCWTGVFQLEDKFGDYGLIGVIFCGPSTAAVWEIDTWLMSCRVLGRRMEQFMFDQLVRAAQAAGIHELIGVYRPTAKNPLVAHHYESLGFEPINKDSAELRYSFAIPVEPWNEKAGFVRLKPE